MTLPPLFDCHFPTFEKDTFNHQIDVYWYQPEFTQSRYPPGQERSDACTLICLLVAQRICQTGLLIYTIEKCPVFNVIMAEAMVEGNATHAWIVKKRLIPHPYLNVEEALKYGGKCLNILKEWTFQVFYDKIEKGLYRNAKNFLNNWYTSPKAKNLFMLLITCNRTVLFIFQEPTYRVTLFDSHSHSTTKSPNLGLVVAQTKIDRLDYLCNWYVEDILNSYDDARPKRYELAFLYPHTSLHSTNNTSCECGNRKK